jgi:Kef-type K+ transport system membrane component KefB
MRKGRILFGLFLIVVGAYAVHSALRWSFKTALFPLSVSIPLIVLVAAQLLLDLFGKAETASGPAIDLELAADVPPDVARRRVINIFFWIAGFILLVFLLGFPIAVPLFILCYLRLQSHESWWLSLSLTAIAWGFFYGVFERLIHLRFEDGLIQTWLGL